jgi:hypothetical protein
MVASVESYDESVSFITYFLVIFFYVIELHVFDIMLYYDKRWCNYEEPNIFRQTHTVFHTDKLKTVTFYSY